MSSEIEICNLALSSIRAGSINSLNESSLQAQLCRLKYPIMRDQILRDAPWQFTHKVKPLAVLSEELFNWAYTYSYPSDCIKINRLVLNLEAIDQDNPKVASQLNSNYYDKQNFKAQVQYEIYLGENDTKVIGANECELRIDYVAKVEDPNLFDSQFILGLSHLLAAELALPIIGGDVALKMREQELQLYGAYIDAALASNSNEQYTPISDSEYVTVRN